MTRPVPINDLIYGCLDLFFVILIIYLISVIIYWTFIEIKKEMRLRKNDKR